MASTCSWMHRDFWYLEKVLPVLREASLRGIAPPGTLFSILTQNKNIYEASQTNGETSSRDLLPLSVPTWSGCSCNLLLNSIKHPLRCTSSSLCGVYAGNTPALLPGASRRPPGTGPACSSVTYAGARWTPRRPAWPGTGRRTGGWRWSGGCPELGRSHLAVAQLRWRTCRVPGSAAR